MEEQMRENRTILRDMKAQLDTVAGAAVAANIYRLSTIFLLSAILGKLW